MEGSAAPRRVPRWITVLLAGSLALNLVVVGFLAGAYLRISPDRNLPFTAFGIRWVIRNLPEADREPFRRVADELQATIQPLRADLRADRARLVELIGAETFDAEAVRALFRSQSTRVADATVMTSDRIVATLAALPPDARRRFAEAMNRPRVRAIRSGEEPAPKAQP